MKISNILLCVFGLVFVQWTLALALTGQQSHTSKFCNVEAGLGPGPGDGDGYGYGGGETCTSDEECCDFLPEPTSCDVFETETTAAECDTNNECVSGAVCCNPSDLPGGGGSDPEPLPTETPTEAPTQSPTETPSLRPTKLPTPTANPPTEMPRPPPTIPPTCEDVNFSGECDCFSATSVVQTPDGPVTMEKLKIGDIVLVETNGQYEAVLSFGGHKDAYHIVPFLSIKLENTFDVLEITHGHYIPKENGELVWAQELVVGDKLWHSGEAKAIVAIDEIQARGRFHPQTYSGQIVVNNFLCSTYVGLFSPRLLAVISRPLRFIAATFPGLAKVFEDAGGVDLINRFFELLAVVSQLK